MQHGRFQKKKAIAIISVVTTMAFLALIATPFLVSMILQKKSSNNFLNQAKARVAARGAFEYAGYYLAQGEYTQELERKIALEKSPSKHQELFSTPDYDTYLELYVPMTPLQKTLEQAILPAHKDKINWNNTTPLQILNQKGVFWSVEVEDEQAKANLNSASPWFLGNLFASALVTEIASETDQTIQVESTENFSPKGGLLWYQGELISYQSTSKKAFLRCGRGLQSQLPEFDPPKTIKKGALLVDARLHKVCRYPYREQIGEFLPYLNIQQIKKIANFGHSFFTAEELDTLFPFLTVHSHSPYLSGWSSTVLLKNDFKIESNVPDQGSLISVFSGGKYNCGTLLRVRDDQHQEYSRIKEFSGNTILLEDHLLHNYHRENTKVDFAAIHPVNINTAREEVLVALFTGVAFYQSNAPITRAQATLIARALIEEANKNQFITSPRSFYDFLEALKKLGILNSTQVEALYLNATDPYGTVSFDDSRSLEVYTAPFCFKNEDVYTIRATGTVHSPTGIPQASHTFQEIIRVAPEKILKRTWETQKDFLQENRDRKINKMVTWPNPITSPKSKEDTSRKKNRGDVRLLPSEISGANLSFQNTIEGAVGPHSYGTFALGGTGNISPGYTEFWVKTSRNSIGEYFGIFPKDSTSPLVDQLQIMTTSGPNLLRLSLMDPCLDGKFTAISFPITLKSQTWYHLMGSWNTNRYGGLSLFLDGMPAGSFDYFDGQGNSLTTELTENIVDINDKSISVTSTRNFPSQGALLIGTEVIEYESKSGNSFKVWESTPKKPKNAGFSTSTGTGRGARTTVAEIAPGITQLKGLTDALGVDPSLLGLDSSWGYNSHSRGSVVLPFGYSTHLSNTQEQITVPLQGRSVSAVDLSKIYVGGSSLQESVDDTFPDTQIDPAIGVQANDLSIPVLDTSKFPGNGYLKIGDELVYYDKKGATSFDSVRRGEGGTRAQAHLSGVVSLNSLHLKNTEGYPDQGWCQIDDEWFGPYSKLGNYFVGILLNSQGQIISSLLERGDGASGAVFHKAGTNVLPVFAVSNASCGAGDLVTIIDSDTQPTQRYLRQIRWARTFGSKPYYLVALNQFLPREIRASDQGRLLKFPSGELPAQPGSGVYGNLLGENKTYDEIKLQQGNFSVWPLIHDVPPNATHFLSAIPIEPGRLIKIGNEFLVAEELQYINGSVNIPSFYLVGPLLRGVLNTASAYHTVGTPYTPLEFVPSSLLERSANAKASEFLLKKNNSVFPSEGYLRIGNEVIGYTQQQNFQFTMPTRKKDEGIFRSRFGSTSNVNHSFGELAIAQPYRYWDRFAFTSESEIACYERVFSSPHALFQAFRWEEELHRDSRLDIVCLVRFNGSPDWEQLPTNRKGGIFLFEQGEQWHSFERNGVQAHQIEMRFLFRYHQGAFFNDSWKETPWLKKIELEYVTPTHTFHTQEKL